jgi:hypothetical protein
MVGTSRGLGGDENPRNWRDELAAAAGVEAPTPAAPAPQQQTPEPADSAPTAVPAWADALAVALSQVRGEVVRMGSELSDLRGGRDRRVAPAPTSSGQPIDTSSIDQRLNAVIDLVVAVGDQVAQLRTDLDSLPAAAPAVAGSTDAAGLEPAIDRISEVVGELVGRVLDLDERLERQRLGIDTLTDAVTAPLPVHDHEAITRLADGQEAITKAMLKLRDSLDMETGQPVTIEADLVRRLAEAHVALTDRQIATADRVDALRTDMAAVRSTMTELMTLLRG